jgi:hypothetical protein
MISEPSDNPITPNLKQLILSCQDFVLDKFNGTIQVDTSTLVKIENQKVFVNGKSIDDLSEDEHARLMNIFSAFYINRYHFCSHLHVTRAFTWFGEKKLLDLEFTGLVKEIIEMGRRCWSQTLAGQGLGLLNTVLEDTKELSSVTFYSFAEYGKIDFQANMIKSLDEQFVLEQTKEIYSIYRCVLIKEFSKPDETRNILKIANTAGVTVSTIHNALINMCFLVTYFEQFAHSLARFGIDDLNSRISLNITNNGIANVKSLPENSIIRKLKQAVGNSCYKKSAEIIGDPFRV